MLYQNVAEFLLLNAGRYPQKTALVHGQERMTYRQLNETVNRLTYGLRRLGIRSGDPVGYLFPNSIRLIEIYYALQKIGAVAVPLNTRLIAKELKFLLRSSRCKSLIFAEACREKVSSIENDFPTVQFIIDAKQTHTKEISLYTLFTESTEEPPLYKNGYALSRIQFTGGTTGLPKGVMRTHFSDIAEIISVMMSSKIGATSDETVLIQCPMDHHGGHSWFTSVIGAGATLIICDHFNEQNILSAIEHEQVTYLLLLPPSSYLRLLEFPSFRNYDVRSVRLVQSAAGSTTPEIIRKIYQGFPNCQMNYGWGQTESGTGSSLVLTLEMADWQLPEAASIGKPMPFIEMKILGEDDKEVPIGKIGECIVRGPTIMAGYYDQPKLTEKVRLAHGWLRTGDMMKKDVNGNFYLMSRKKEMIKTGGENVFAQEVADVIRKHEKVQDCIVFGIPDKKFGEAIMAVLQLRKGMSMTLSELQEHCKKYLASYKKPLYIETIDCFPRNDAGKMQKYKLVQKFREKMTIQNKVG
ncbi:MULTISPECIES: class I adenylate-forming enzyme family protein [unclassified Sporolactobacillus]|uniref:class I adenylate-forming enzyme family protein n=1 Tax=unclassified Sporolactobacillus TaxID=2628533 RepID=UPI002368EB5C|nr:class I adenylate-forming enzyme family protein [Sporolactobacillus sp. CQH2019]MDD9146951.1 class I adenylate-forming enzyme family protein [Sporolactobacillus sp. CQH2019]